MSKTAGLSRRILPPAAFILVFLQAAIVVTGGAVRLTRSGLGCPTWPECTPGSYTPVPDQAEGQFHAWIEFGNRLLTFVLVVAALITLIAVVKAGRRDLRILAAGQVLGIFAQGILGGITVLTDLNPISVASHYLLSTILIAAATSLYTRRRLPSIKKISPRAIDIFSRAHVSSAALVVILGTIVTGAGPHAGDVDSARLKIAIATAVLMHTIAVVILMVLTIAFFLHRQTSDQSKRLLVIFAIITIGQGAIGAIQYIQGVPELLVAAHLLGATLVWIGAWKIWLSVQRTQIADAHA
ncbi:MAG: COX15/CtaA family protein [Actinomycetota bacterium]|nr:COX15/CtaA family protein [Actinomycetota bacterium]